MVGIEHTLSVKVTHVGNSAVILSGTAVPITFKIHRRSGVINYSNIRIITVMITVMLGLKEKEVQAQSTVEWIVI